MEVTTTESQNEDQSELLGELPQGEVEDESLILKPLLLFRGYIPNGWKDAIYGRDGTGSADPENEW